MISFFVLEIACGKRGPSLPPIIIAPDKCSDIMVRQIGDSLLIAFSLPEKNTDGSPLKEIPSMELLVYVSEAASEEPRLDEFLRNAQRLPVSPDELANIAIGKKIFLDKKLSDLSSSDYYGLRYTVAVRLLNMKKRISPLSDISSVTTVKPIKPPANLSALSEEEGIRLSWKPSPSEEDQSCGSFFNIYRREISQDEHFQADAPDLLSAEAMRNQLIPLNQKPISEHSYLDKSSLFGKTYLYSVRAICDASLPPRESNDSNIVFHSYHDEFPPAPPSGLAAVSEEGIIRLFWFPNAERDCAGYKVYRKSEDDDVFSLIASLPAYKTSFSDEDITPRVQYRYYVTAVDMAHYPNESHPSEVVYETASRGMSAEEEAEQ